MTVDLTEFEQASRKAPGKRCGVAELYDVLDQSQAEKLTAAMAQPVDRITHAAIVTVLKGWEHPISRNVIGHHRNAGCSCGR